MRGFSACSSAALLLAAGVAAAVSAVTVRVSHDGARPADRKSYVLPSLTADYVTRALRESGDSKKALEEARAWAKRLEEALSKVSTRRRVGSTDGGRRRRRRRRFDELRSRR